MSQMRGARDRWYHHNMCQWEGENISDCMRSTKENADKSMTQNCFSKTKYGTKFKQYQCKRLKKYIKIIK